MSFASLRRLWRDRCGITSLEFALTFPIIMAFIVGTLELDRYMFLQLQLQSAVNDASRYGLTGVANTDAANQVVCPIASGFGPVPPITPTYEIICRIDLDICPNGPALNQCAIDVNTLNVQIASFQNLENLSTNSQPLTGPGPQNNLTVYSVTYPLPLVTGALNHFISGTLQISGYTIVYNEPFGQS